MRRVLIGEAPVRLPGAEKSTIIPTLVGILFWNGEDERLATVVVKAAGSFRDGAKLAFVEPRPFVGRSDLAGKANDFVPAKDACDILLTGHVDLAAGRDGAEPLHVLVRAPDATLAFTIASRTPGRTALDPAHVQIAGEGISDVGPRKSQLDPAMHDFVFPTGFDYQKFQAAHPRLQSKKIGTAGRIVFEGLVPWGGELAFDLPPVGARALLDWTRAPQPSDVGLKLDTIHVDLDSLMVDLVWRGTVKTPIEPRSQIDRVLVGFASDDAHDETRLDRDRFAPILAELARGKFSYAWELADVLEGKAPPPLPEEEREMARYEALESTTAPAPTLTLAEHARVVAELLEIVPSPGTGAPTREEREARAETLRRHGFDEFTWSIEERAHADRLASVPADSDGGMQTEYSNLFVEAQNAVAPPNEPLPSARDYASLTIALQVRDPRSVLSEAKLSLGAWMRIERRWQKKMNDDPAAEREVDGWLEREAATQGEPRIPEIDEERGIVK